jgi:hypothetical protein
MLPAKMLAIALPLLCAPIGTGSPPALDIHYTGGAIAAKVTGPSQDFLGAVILSDSGQLSHFVVGLPPLLTTYVILGIGQAHDGVLPFVVQHATLPPVDLEIFAQGVTLDAGVVASSDVMKFVVPATR